MPWKIDKCYFFFFLLMSLVLITWRQSSIYKAFGKKIIWFVLIAVTLNHATYFGAVYMRQNVMCVHILYNDINGFKGEIPSPPTWTLCCLATVNLKGVVRRKTNLRLLLWAFSGTYRAYVLIQVQCPSHNQRKRSRPVKCLCLSDTLSKFVKCR